MNITVSTNGLVRLLGKMIKMGEGEYTSRISGTPDPTEIRSWIGGVQLQYGLGPCNVTEGEPPEPDGYVISIHDITWGIEVEIYSELTDFRLRFYLDKDVIYRPQIKRSEGQDVEIRTAIEKDSDISGRIHSMLWDIIIHGEFRPKEDIQNFWQFEQNEV